MFTAPPAATPPALIAAPPIIEAQPAISGDHQRFSLQSELPYNDPRVDTIQVEYYPARGTNGKSAPAVIVLPPIGGTAEDPLMRRLAESGANAGINIALMTLPFHGDRWPASEGRHPDPALHFLSGNAERSAQAFAQSASDVMTVVTYLTSRSEVDAAHIGIVGTSLGAIVAHLAMGRDNRIGAGVALLGAGDLRDISLHSFSTHLVRWLHPSERIPRDFPPERAAEQLHRVDPLTYADENQPRHVFMVEAARDIVLPPRDADELWKALGKPPIRWIDTNHFALRFAAAAAFGASITYFHDIWAAPNAQAASLVQPPRLSVPTIKLGFMAQEHGPNSLGLVPDVTYQLGSIGSYSSHYSVAHADLGLSTRGPFVAASFTVSAYVDAGFASRLGRTIEAPRPYLGMHLTF